ncbi:MAG TPA: Rieske 2Fe-2S domain-containing protein [Steroidobacteraceae bacterium]|nr:Rieske 2Fe-2S domain-containing protein [Steroidobacteraceae bacterium]
MTQFIEVARLDEVPVGTGTTFHVGGKQVAVFNVAGTIYAIGDSCAHAGGSLGSGKLEGNVVTCRSHGMRYDVRTGEVTTGGLQVPAYPVKVIDGKIFIAPE